MSSLPAADDDDRSLLERLKPDDDADPAESSDAGGDSSRLTRFREGSLVELLYVSLPLMISTGSHSLMQACDRLFLTAVGTDELGAAFSAGMLNWTLLSIPLATLGYAATFVSQYHGAGEDEAARASVWQSFWLALVVSVPLLAVAPFAESIFRVIGHEPRLQELEATYFRIMIFALPLRLLIGSFFCHFSGRGENVVPMTAAIIGNGFNIALTYALVFGTLGTQPLGLSGAAYGTVAATVLELVFYLAFIALRRPHTLPSWWRSRRFDRGLSLRLLRFGLPNGVQMFSDALAFTIALQVVGTIGPDELAATTIALSTNGVVFVPLIGLGMATGTIVGHRIGAKRPESAVRSVRLAAGFGLLMMGTFAAVCIFLPEAILWPYEQFGGAKFTPLRPLLLVLLRFLAAFALFDSLAVVMGFAIRGAGDTRFSLLVLTAAGWGLLTLPILAMAMFDQLTLFRCWTMLTLTVAAQGVAFTLRFLGGKWKSMSVMEPSVIREDDVE